MLTSDPDSYKTGDDLMSRGANQILNGSSEGACAGEMAPGPGGMTASELSGSCQVGRVKWVARESNPERYGLTVSSSPFL